MSWMRPAEWSGPVGRQFLSCLHQQQFELGGNKMSWKSLEWCQSVALVGSVI